VVINVMETRWTLFHPLHDRAGNRLPRPSAPMDPGFGPTASLRHELWVNYRSSGAAAVEAPCPSTTLCGTGSKNQAG